MDCEDSRKRSMDRRRETSRCAARERRGKESDVFSDLRDVVPLVEDGATGHLDRIALLRVASTVVRFRSQAASLLDDMVVPKKSSCKVNVWSEDTVTECLDGFIINCDADGQILYITESVAIYLGLTQTDLCGRGLKDFLQADDYNEFREVVAQLITNKTEDGGRAVVLRMKTVISPRGRNLNMKSALLKPVSFVIRARKVDGVVYVFMQGVCVPAGQGSVNANATALTKGSDTPSGAYMTRHTCDMRISFISERFNYILKSDLKSLMGASFYELVHPADVELIAKSMKELFTKGHIRTPYYRLIASNGNLCWVMTEANTTSHTCKGQKGQYVVCVHFVIGVQEPCETLVMCTDSAPAGLPVEIKKEIDDIRDYVGRQPEVIDAENYVPLFMDEPCNRIESLLPDENGAPPGRRQDRSDEVLDWLFRGQQDSPCPLPKAVIRSQTNDPTLASAALMAQNEATYQDNFGFATTIAGRSQAIHRDRVGSFNGSFEEFSHSRSAQNFGHYNGSGSLSSGTASSTPPVLSNIPSPDVNVLPRCDRRENSTMYSSLLTADSNDRNGLANGTRIVEDLRWEEPDLTGLAPFVPDDDIIDFGAEPLPKDLEMLFSDMPEWHPAQPLVARGNPACRGKMESSYNYRSNNMNSSLFSGENQHYWEQRSNNWENSNNISF